MHVMGTAGHVDHGKSALVQRLSGIDPDRFAEEKRRGLTIDLGFAWVPLPSGREIGLIDVPGHERFIKNMLAGAGGISVCLFVVAANEGWKPQSAEHLAILDVLGISSAVVALTKSDMVDEDALGLVTTQIEDRLSHSSLRGAPIVPCSSVTGTGIDRLKEVIDAVVGYAPAAPDRGRPRLWVDRSFTIAGAGTVVTGTLTGGTFSVGADVEISPAGRRARVRVIQSHKRELRSVGPGNRVALNLAGVDRGAAERGDAIVLPGQWRPTSTVDALVKAIPSEISGDEHDITEKGSYLLYAGSAETPIALKLLDGERLRSGQTSFAQIYLRQPLPLQREDRFVVRDAGRVLTVGGGRVLDPLPAPARREDPERLVLLSGLVAAGADQALQAIVASEGAVDAADALLRSGARTWRPPVTKLGASLVSAQRLTSLMANARDILERHHIEHPLERGVRRESLRAQLALDTIAFEDLVAGAPDIIEEGARVRLSDHYVRFDPAQQQERDRILRALGSHGYSPPPAADLEADPGVLGALLDEGELVKIADFYLTRTLAREARAAVRALIGQQGAVTVAQIRDLLGTSRKYAVPLCEWLDATGATRRRGDVRVLGPTA